MPRYKLISSLSSISRSASIESDEEVRRHNVANGVSPDVQS